MKAQSLEKSTYNSKLLYFDTIFVFDYKQALVDATHAFESELFYDEIL